MQEFMMEHPGWSFLIAIVVLAGINRFVHILRTGRDTPDND